MFNKGAENYINSPEFLKLPESGKSKLAEFSLKGELVSDYLSSEKSRAVIIDLAINTGLGGVATRISKGIRDYIVENSITEKSTLLNVNETDILLKIKPYAFVPDRIQKAIDDASL